MITGHFFYILRNAGRCVPGVCSYTHFIFTDNNHDGVGRITGKVQDISGRDKRYERDFTKDPGVFLIPQPSFMNIPRTPGLITLR
jgi:hypothetical protein